MELFETTWTFVFVFLSWVSLAVVPISACPTECSCVALVTKCTVLTTWPTILNEIPTKTTSLTIECKSQGKIQSLDNLGNLTAVEELSILNCGLTSVRTHHIRPIRGLKKLILKGNQIKSIEINTFIQLSELTEFNIESNNLTDLPNRIFVEQKKLEIIRMNKNQLQKIGAEYFQGLTNLKILELRENNIQSISAGSLNLPNVEKVDIGNNKLTEIRSKDFSAMGKLKELNLVKNSIEKIETGAFKIKTLLILYLSYNRIRTIDPGLYSTDLKKLYLQDNLIQVIDEKARTDFFPHLDALALFGNPLHCNCKMTWLKKYFDDKTKTSPNLFQPESWIKYPSCHTPVPGPLATVNLTDFTCVKATFTGISSAKMGPVCKGNGDPVPVITWTGPSGQVVKIHQPHDNKSDPDAIGELQLEGDMESGIYTCTVSNFQQTQNSTLHVQIFKADMPVTTPCTTITTAKNEKGTGIQTPVQFPLYVFIAAVGGSVLGTALLVGLIAACCTRSRRSSEGQSSRRGARRANVNPTPSSLNRTDFVREPRSDPNNVYETLSKDKEDYLEPKALDRTVPDESNFKSIERNILMGPETTLPMERNHNRYNFNAVEPSFIGSDRNPRISRGAVVSLTSNQ